MIGDLDPVKYGIECSFGEARKVELALLVLLVARSAQRCPSANQE